MNNKKIDLGEAFDTWKEETFIPYRGVLLEKLPNGFKCMGLFCLNMLDVDRVLDSCRSSLANSIKKSTINGAK